MRAVVAGFMAYVKVVALIVPAERDLRAAINLVNGCTRCMGLRQKSSDVFLCECYIFGIIAECRMVYFAAGIDDSDYLAFAGVIKIPGFNSVYLRNCVEQLGNAPFGSYERMIAFDAVDLVYESVFAVKRESVEKNGIIVDRNNSGIECTVQRCNSFVLSRKQLSTVILCSCAFKVFANLYGRLGIKLYQNGDDVVGLKAFFFFNIGSFKRFAVSDARNVDFRGNVSGFKCAFDCLHLCRTCSFRKYAGECGNYQKSSHQASYKAFE